MKLIRLTEQDLHRIVKESVNVILKEISDDTLNAAIDASNKKVYNYEKKYGSDSEVARAARKQGYNFKNNAIERYMSAPQRKRARIDKNDIDRRNGEREYIRGVGWRTKSEKY